MPRHRPGSAGGGEWDVSTGISFQPRAKAPDISVGLASLIFDDLCMYLFFYLTWGQKGIKVVIPWVSVELFERFSHIAKISTQLL